MRILRAHPELETITYRDGLDAAAQALRDQGITVADNVLDTAEELLKTRYQQRLRDENTPGPLSTQSGSLRTIPGARTGCETRSSKLAASTARSSPHS
ncbi:hypothetical protein [Nocardia sp. NPDC050175]|uniref:hypothetical protein n=1 Tax=Nocardia sp. NPDC050175 TaxID=3364317 RepID=UPI003789A8D2